MPVRVPSVVLCEVLKYFFGFVKVYLFCQSIFSVFICIHFAGIQMPTKKHKNILKIGHSLLHLFEGPDIP